MIRYINKYTAVIKMTWIQTLEYRANLFVGLFAIFSGIFIEYLIWKQIFIARETDSIRGFALHELIAFIFLSMIVGQLKSSWVTSIEMIDAIRTGGLNKYLIRPLSFYIYHLMMFIGHNSLFYLAYFTLIIAFPFIFPGLAFTTISQIFGFLGALLIAVYLSYNMYYMMVCVSFWFHEVRALVIAYNIANIILSGQVIPLRFFPESYLNIIRYTPLPFLVDLPVSIATGQLSMELWETKFMLGIWWCLITWVFGKILYHFGIKQYGGYGA
jgi:ABC-2 type transport system permease protein